MRSLRQVAVSALLAASMVAGCSTGGSPGIEIDAGTGIVAAEQEAGEKVAQSDVDACALLTDAEVLAVIGASSGPRGHGGQCTWENPQTYQSVTVDIGATATAAGGQLPDPDPGAKTSAGPDGIRFSSGNVAEFVIGTRACRVQVAVTVTDESDRPTQVMLISLIRKRVPA